MEQSSSGGGCHQAKAKNSIRRPSVWVRVEGGPVASPLQVQKRLQPCNRMFETPNPGQLTTSLSLSFSIQLNPLQVVFFRSHPLLPPPPRVNSFFLLLPLSQISRNVRRPQPQCDTLIVSSMFLYRFSLSLTQANLNSVKLDVPDVSPRPPLSLFFFSKFGRFGYFSIVFVSCPSPPTTKSEDSNYLDAPSPST